MNRILFYVCALTLSSFSSAMSFDFNSRVWAKGTYDFADAVEPRFGFDIYRGFLNPVFKFSERWSSNIIIEAKTTTTKTHVIGTSAPFADLFHAYVERKGKLRIRFGLLPNSYLIPMYGRLKTRWLGMALPQAAGYLGARQAGIGARYIFSDRLEFASQFHNGDSGYGKSTSNGPAAAFTLTYHCFEGASLLGSYEYSTREFGVSAQQVGSLGAFWSGGRLTLFLESVARILESGPAEIGFGATAVLGIAENTSLYGRFFTGNDSFQSQGIGADSLLSVGPVYQLSNGIQGALIYERRGASSGGPHAVSLLVAADFSAIRSRHSK